MASAALFWTIVGFIAIPFVLYPASIALLGGVLRRRPHSADITPTVSVLIAAFDEEGTIGDKIRNTLAQQYPPDKLQVVVIDDGSTDATLTEARSVSDERVTVLSQQKRAGKTAALVRGARHCHGEILVLTDANAEFEPDAIAALVRPFADDDVGGVCGNQLNRPGNGPLALGERVYWEYDKFLKQMESNTGSIVGADGSIYALRRSLFEAPIEGATDDFCISSAVIATHHRFVFARDAKSLETPFTHSGDQFRRRARITSRSAKGLFYRRRLLNPAKYGIYSWVMAGHKVFRRLASPAILLLLPATAWAALGHKRGYRLALGAQAALYLSALAGWLLHGHTQSRILAIPYYFVVGIAGTTAGLWRFARGETRTTWDPIRED